MVTALRTDREAAAAAKTPSPPHAFKLVPFSGKADTWLAFHRSLAAAMERPPFSPGGAALITTSANLTASSQLRAIILEALSGDAAARFDNRPHLFGKGFEMVSILREAYAPTGELAVMHNFCALTSLHMTADELLATYMSRVRDTVALLYGGKVALNPVLVNLFAVKGLSAEYAEIKRAISLHPEDFSSITLDALELRCNIYTRTTQSLDTNTPSPAAAAATPSLPPPPPTASTTPDPSATLPRETLATRMKSATSICPLCHQKHSILDCGYILRAGFVIEYNPEKARETYSALNLHGNRKAPSDPDSKGPAASAVFMPMSSTILPPSLAATLPPPPSDASDASVDRSIFAAALTYTMDREYDAYEELSDNEEGLCEHPGIPSRASGAAAAIVLPSQQALTNTGKWRPPSVPQRPFDPG